MLTKLITNLLTCLWFLCALFSYTQTASAQTVTITTGDWAPLISENLPGNGPISIIVKEAFSHSNIEVKFRFVPWKRAMREVDIGSSDASSVWRATDERRQKFLLSDDVYENENVFFYLKSRPFDWKTFNDLKKYQMGAVLGYAYSTGFEAAEQKGDFEVFRVNKEKLLVDMLLSGRIHAFPANREVGLDIIRSKAPELFNDFAIHPKPLIKKPLRLIVKKNAKGRALLKKFNAGLKTLKSSGRFEEIYGKGPTP